MLEDDYTSEKAKFCLFGLPQFGKTFILNNLLFYNDILPVDPNGYFTQFLLAIAPCAHVLLKNT